MLVIIVILVILVLVLVLVLVELIVVYPHSSGFGRKEGAREAALILLENSHFI